MRNNLKYSQNQRNEDNLHKQICKFLQYQYPNLIFSTDLSGVFLPKGLAKKVSVLKSSRGFPDIMIFKPIGNYHGAFFELKKSYETIFTKKNAIRNDAHLQEQLELMNRLSNLGYFTAFIYDIEQGILTINNYLKGIY